MASVVSGCSSVEQDADLVRRIRELPGTPVKMSMSKAGTSSVQRRRGLFLASPASDSSGGLGHMSPLSSSLESLHTIASPSFSPNGQCYYETPTKTPFTPVRDIAVRSSLFPALTKFSPKLRSTKKIQESPSIRQSMAVLEDIVCETDSSQVTPRSSQRSRRIVAETITTPSSVGTPPSQRKTKKRTNNIVPPSPAITSPDAKPVAEEDFYGAPVSKPVVPGAPKSVPQDKFYGLEPKTVSPDNFYAPATPRPILVIDTLESRGRKLSRDSETRSYVSGAAKRPRSTSRSASRSGKRHKGVIPGVWHGIKKPKKIKKNAPKPKPCLSPNTRIEKLKDQPVKRVKCEKSLFKEKPLNRIARSRKRIGDQEDIVDTFPCPLIKRKKLPSSPMKEPLPDLSKKFVKHGAYRKATFKLDHMQLEYKNGKVRVKTPEKQRRVRAKKLHKPQLDPVDFSLQEPETSNIQKDVDKILQQLIEGDEDSSPPDPVVQVNKISDMQLMHILESPTTKVSFVEATPTKMLTEIHSSPQRDLLANMSSLQLEDYHTPDFGRLSATGVILSAATNILNADPLPENDENVATPKVFPVFDPTSWKSTSVLTDLSNGQKQGRRKMPLVADDQYLLDAGQKSIGVVCCKECGVMYQSGDYLDEVAHNNIHNHLSELSFQGWKDERVVSKFKDGRIILVTASDPKSWQEKARKVVSVVDVELGFSECTLTWIPGRKVLLFICDKLKQVVGCLVSEPCSAGYRMYPSIGGVEIDTCARESTQAKVGVSRIWTALHRRRRSVATRLFHSLRRLAGDISPDDIAFSIPSPDGKMLARSLVGREDFKVYGFLTS